MLLLFEYKETLLEREALHGNVTGAAAVIINLDKSLADVLTDDSYLDIRNIIQKVKFS